MTKIETKNTEWHKKDYTITMKEANIYAVLGMAPFMVVFIVLYVQLWGWDMLVTQWSGLFDGFQNLLISYGVFLLIFAVGIVVHELIHGLSWAWLAKKPWSKIKFGFQLKTFTPYCHIKEPIDVRAYRWGAALPGIITGFTPTIIGLLMGHIGVFVLGLVFVFAAGGDASILWILRKVPAGALVEDHPSLAGCSVLEPNSAE